MLPKTTAGVSCTPECTALREHTHTRPWMHPDGCLGGEKGYYRAGAVLGGGIALWRKGAGDTRVPKGKTGWGDEGQRDGGTDGHRDGWRRRGTSYPPPRARGMEGGRRRDAPHHQPPGRMLGGIGMAKDPPQPRGRSFKGLLALETGRNFLLLS